MSNIRQICLLRFLTLAPGKPSDNINLKELFEICPSGCLVRKTWYWASSCDLSSFVFLLRYSRSSSEREVLLLVFFTSRLLSMSAGISLYGTGVPSSLGLWGREIFILDSLKEPRFRTENNSGGQYSWQSCYARLDSDTCESKCFGISRMTSKIVLVAITMTSALKDDLE